jgi:hypothetical protein
MPVPCFPRTEEAIGLPDRILLAEQFAEWARLERAIRERLKGLGYGW